MRMRRTARARWERVVWLVMDVGYGCGMGAGGSHFIDIFDSPNLFFHWR